MGFMESFVGMALGIALVAVGFGLGVLFRFHRVPPAPKSDGLGSAVILLKQVTDKAQAECAAQREFATDIVTHLIDSNDKLANKCIAIADNQLERMRIEASDPEPAPRREPFVDGFRADPGQQPEVVIEDRRNNHIG